jgi:hypothetical protein
MLAASGFQAAKRHYLTVDFNNYVQVAKHISALGLAAEFFQRPLR